MRWLVAVAALLLVVLPLAAARAQSPVMVDEVTVHAREGATRILVKTSGPVSYRAARLDAPTRLVLDLPDARSGWRGSPLRIDGDIVKEIRNPPRGADGTRIVIELSHASDYLITRARDGLRVVLPPPEPSAAVAPAARAGSPADSSAAAPSLQGVARSQRGWVAYLENPASRTVAGYQVGDTVADRTVEAIDLDRVILAGRGGRVEMRLVNERAGTIQRLR